MQSSIHTYAVSVTEEEVNELLPTQPFQNVLVYCCRHPAVVEANWGPWGDLVVIVRRDPDYLMTLDYNDPQKAAVDIVKRLIQHDDSVLEKA